MDSSDEYEQMDNLESDGDYEPSGEEAADDDEIPFEGTSQSAQKRMRKEKKKLDNVEGERMRKRKKKSDNFEGELETTGGLAKEHRHRNHINFQVHDADSQKERGAAAETKSSGRGRRKFRKQRKGFQVYWEGQDAKWVKSLRGPHLRLMQALKELGTERVNTIKEDSLYNCLTPAALRVIGIILEEHVKEQLSLLGSEAPGDGEQKMQNGDSSSPDGLQSADNGRRVDDVDGKQDDTKTRMCKSSQTFCVAPD